MGAETAMLKVVSRGLKAHYDHADEIEQVVIKHALGATVSAAAAGACQVLEVPLQWRFLQAL